MDEIYGFHSTSNNYHEYTERGLKSPENLIIPGEYQYHQYNNYHSSIVSAGHSRRVPVLGSDGLGLVQSSVLSESASINNIKNQRGGVVDDEQQAAAASIVIKAKIASHPSYPKLVDAYIDCQKVGAPPEIACLLEEIRRDKELLLSKQDTVSMCCLEIDPELDEFMETYCDILVKYKSDLSRPFDEAISFLNEIETQLGNLSKDDGGLSSEEELSGGETEIKGAQVKSGDRELKDRLLHRYGSHISSLKLEFSKKTKKGKLPKEARQMLQDWWNDHCRWPYPTEGDKISLAQSTGLDQKQINNWFINQRKRHWKPSENMQLAIMENLSGHFVVGN